MSYLLCKEWGVWDTVQAHLMAIQHYDLRASSVQTMGLKDEYCPQGIAILSRETDVNHQPKWSMLRLVHAQGCETRGEEVL